MSSENDIRYMRMCFDLARKGSGLVSPNPLVGAVIVKNGKIISTGYHQKFGEAHAERNAILNSNEDLTGAALYCNLEPCCHTDKKTPPCAPLIISSGIKKVLISTLDPNPKVSGRGIKELQAAGIRVQTEILENEGYELNKFFFKYIKEKIPYIMLKMAVSIDGKISGGTGIQTWLTGKESAEYVHRQRAIYDAVLIGANTVNIDNPQLNVRFAGGRNPKKIIIDGKLNCDIQARLFNSDASNTWIFTSKESDSLKKSELQKKGCRIFECESGNGDLLSLRDILTILAAENISSVMVEGGKEIFSQFISQGLFDELVILQSPKILGKGLEAFHIELSVEAELKSVENLGGDVKMVYLKKE